jgi:hypothetical protein
MALGRNPWLVRYWIEFARGAGDATRPNWLPAVVGVTAYSVEDALAIVRAYAPRLDSGQLLPDVARVVENVDLSAAEFDRYRSWIGAPIWRGLWYPDFTYAPLGRRAA